MTNARTVRARVGAELAAEIDAAIEREERTESDIVRRALRAYIAGTVLTPDYFAAALENATGVPVGKFRGPDPKVKK